MCERYVWRKAIGLDIGFNDNLGEVPGELKKKTYVLLLMKVQKANERMGRITT